MDALMALVANEHANPHTTSYMGLAPFLRDSIAGKDLRLIGAELLALVDEHPSDAPLLMNVSLAMQCLGERELGLAFQAEALAIQRIYPINATEQPARIKVLMLMVPGDIAANTPLECLLESSDIDLVYYFLTFGNLFSLPIPEHDVLLVALGESEENRKILDGLENHLSNWPKPVVNLPKYIPSTDRHVLSKILQGSPGLLIPMTWQTTRSDLIRIAAYGFATGEFFSDCNFPIIIRPVGSQAGRDLEKLQSEDELLNYLSRIQGDKFFIARFIDYRSEDGLFRKYRIAMIDGVSFACHMGVSTHWMVHYVNAGMYEEAWKRVEETNFMAKFEDFAQKHCVALKAIHDRIQLDYFCLDCAETLDGRLLLFELDNCMIVHAMDSEEMFPYKQLPMLKVKIAFQDYLLHLHERNN